MYCPGMAVAVAKEYWLLQSGQKGRLREKQRSFLRMAANHLLRLHIDDFSNQVRCQRGAAGARRQRYGKEK